MSELFMLSAPWWHYPLRATAVYVVVMLLMRLSGKRAVGQFTPFDLVLLVLVGTAVQNGLVGDELSLTGAFLLAGTLIALNWIVAYATSRWHGAEAIVEGVPRVLARNGVLFRDVLRAELVSENDFNEVLRVNDIAGLDQVALALLETNGEISVMCREDMDDARQRNVEAGLPAKAFRRDEDGNTSGEA
ncbi:MAG: DUF421 domain-containing protein [Pseudoxanthomonas suwonensis]|nr:DUF421 domain-containing protein [Pseudoxanthomonas suwonensis]